MTKIKLLVRSTEDEAPVLIRLTDGRKVDINRRTNININPIHWDAEKEQIKTSRSTDKNVVKKNNLALQKLKAELLQHYIEKPTDVKANTKWLKDFINPEFEQPEEAYTGFPKELMNYWKEFNKTLPSRKTKKGTLVTKGTIANYKCTERLFERYDKYLGREIMITDVGLSFAEKFTSYCAEKNYSINTIGGHIKCLKSVCAHAHYINGMDAHRQLTKIEPVSEEVDNVWLTDKMIDTVEATRMDWGMMDDVCDWLLISCDTAQRFSDFMNFKPENIRHLEDGTTLLDLEQRKGKKKISIYLSSRVLRILEKRGGQFPPIVGADTYNDWLKIIGKRCGFDEQTYGGKHDGGENGVGRKVWKMYAFWELMTSHIGRRSFASNYYGKIPTALLMAQTGHTNEQTFLRYIGKSNADRTIELAKYLKREEKVKELLADAA